MNDEKKHTKIYTRHRLRIPKVYANEKQKKILKKTCKMLIIFIIIILVANVLLSSIDPIVKERCSTITKSVATKISNEQATKVMEDYEYKDLVNIIKDKNDKITMINTNIININKIISDIPIKIQEEIEKSENNNFNIKLGSFFGSNLLSGLGPDINIQIQLDGSVETDLKSEFKSQGINQTLHRIYLEVKCKIAVLTPFNVIKEEIINQVLLVEGIIAGEIPQTYYNLDGLDNDQQVDIIN